jgi:hypothetical protein
MPALVEQAQSSVFPTVYRKGARTILRDFPLRHAEVFENGKIAATGFSLRENAILSTTLALLLRLTIGRCMGREA